MNGPYNWIYLLGFAVLIAMSYNGSWALAQKYYSVQDTRDASKAAYLSAALNLVGAPVMILPSMIGRQLLPDLIAQHRTADAYVLLILKVLPAGMVGIIIAALLSATMATVSADFNSIAAVLTQDVYHRLLRPGANPRQLVRTGRVVTVMVGAASLSCSLWIAFSGQQSLLELMVTVAGVFLAPSYLPLLAALISRRLTWKGALLGYSFGIASGFGMLYAVAAILAGAPSHRQLDARVRWHHDSVQHCGDRWGNVGRQPVSPESGRRTEPDRHIFQKLDQPVARVAAGDGPRAALVRTTVAVGGLLAVAALLTPALGAKAIDLGVAVLLVAIGAAMRSRRVKKAAL